MNKQLYVKLEEAEALKEGDIWGNDASPVEAVFFGDLMGEEFSYPAFRPVSIERVTGTESAFPAFDGSGAVGGMTLREHYAGLAMRGILASRKVSGDGVFPWEEIAPSSVQMADALIAALNKKEEAA